MRVFFAAYCFGGAGGHSLIGVYKRVLRLGLELERRGHEVVILCTGREHHYDGLVAAATARLRFVDAPLSVVLEPDVELKRSHYRTLLEELRTDLVVIGEAPIAGVLFDMTVVAVQLGIPVLVLDNAYRPSLVRSFIRDHGAMVDWMLLTGPASFQLHPAPRQLCQVAPFVERTPGAGDALFESLGVSDAGFVTVLAYEPRAESLAVSLLDKLPEPCPLLLFIARDPDDCRTRLDELPEQLRHRTRVLPAPDEAAFFDLIARSRLVIGKCGFMQITECLALGTPFVGVSYRGCLELAVLPGTAAPYVYGTVQTVADVDAVAAVRRLLQVTPDELEAVHDGTFRALETAAQFIDSLPPEPRRIERSASAALGYTEEVVRSILEGCHPNEPVELEGFRCARIRRTLNSSIDSIVCSATMRGRPARTALWGHWHHDAQTFENDLANAENRQIVFSSQSRRLIVETDRGERFLPPLH